MRKVEMNEMMKVDAGKLFYWGEDRRNDIRSFNYFSFIKKYS